jgi:hypothetical protein
MKAPLLTILLCLIASTVYAQDKTFRPPSVPLVVHDPYFSIWSPANKLTDAETVHWTGKKHSLHAMIRIDGKTYRLMGAEPKDVPAMEQTGLSVTPLETVYTFGCDEATVQMAFRTPLLPNDLDLMSRPATYIICSANTKGKSRDMAFYFDAGAEIAVNQPEQTVTWSKLDIPDTTTIKLGSVDQPILGKRGDDLRIDWGHMLFSVRHVVNFPAELGPKFTFVVQPGTALRKSFAEKGKIAEESVTGTLPAADLSIGHVWTMEKPFNGGVTVGVILAYDDIDSVRYFGDDLKAWWKRDGKTTEAMLAEAWDDAVAAVLHKPDNLSDRCMAFDKQFYTDMEKVGGKDYANLCALAYRHAFGAQKIVADANGMPLMFSKENFSNGCMGTVDLMYPCGPMLLYYSPALMKATLQPVFAYAETEKWKFPFAPHDLGTYPHATGQVYGGGERTEQNQMPVEESANMIILTAALAIAEQNTDFAKLHWKTLTKWADYLLDKGFDPENQLCTDDFAGHLAHNVNLSAKAIVAIGAYSQLAEQLAEKEIDKATAKKYRIAAETFALRWIKEADDGDHFRLAFDRSGTWSMKYNLMWDEILDLKLFPKEVMRKEIAYYKTKMQKYGLPLDNRSLYTKNDWILWTATMCENRADFDAFVAPVVGFINNTENRVPLSDWYFTDSAKQRGFQARSVVGGFWAPMLKDRKKWLEQAAKGADIDNRKKWADIVMPDKAVKIIAPTANDGKVEWQYTTAKPADGWEKPDFNDSAWKTGQAGFGTRDTPGVIVGTIWNTNDIWIRRSFDWDGVMPDNTELRLFLHHDDDVDVYLNGTKIVSRTGWTTSYELVSVPNLAETLKKGKNTFAVQVKQNGGGQYIDVGISVMEKPKR